MKQPSQHQTECLARLAAGQQPNIMPSARNRMLAEGWIADAAARCRRDKNHGHAYQVRQFAITDAGRAALDASPFRITAEKSVARPEGYREVKPCVAPSSR